MDDRMTVLKNFEVRPEYQTERREMGGYLVSPDCRCKRGCSLCLYSVPISPMKLTKAEYEFTRPKTRWVDRTVARQKYFICPYERCPFTEMDDFPAYRLYEEEERKKIVDIRGFIRLLMGV